ncbi:MAG: hypothetical protein ABJF04_05720 [Reichenbachiella sp.]|uniref:NAD(P)H-dependent amine dehydrogenase family protein n=1 Tax=Reichenbachiella sp. TaxID=2184521 RepID=UPI003266E440
MKNRIKVLQIGMGPLGVKISEFIAQRRGIMTTAVVDNNPDLVGRPLQDLNHKAHPELIIRESVAKAIYIAKPDVAVLTTSSTMEQIYPQIEEILKHRISVVSTCEELSYPWDCSPELASRIDELAKKQKVSVLGTGVNPGFLMDALPSFMTALNQDVESIKVKRYQNAAYRRRPFQQKIGAGLAPDEFEKRKNSGRLRHVGLTESIQFIANSLGWELTKTTDEILPVLAEADVQHDQIQIKSGKATGVRQIGTGYIGDEQKIKLEFQAAVGEQSSYDEIEIVGSPNIKSRIDGGVNGDIATCAITVNAARQILNAKPGLRTMADMPMISYFN